MRIQRTLVGVTMGLVVSAASAQETIGPWEILAAPVSATLVAGGDGTFGWLNVVDRPVSLSEAFSGFSIIDDGFANADAGTIIEVTFALGDVVNIDGPDIVLFEARFDDGAYAVSTEYDGFLMEFFLPLGAFQDTGVDRDYYYENNNQINAADVWAAQIDLSDLGVPLGESVASIRFRATNDLTDPLGIGSLVPTPGALALLGVAGIFAPRRRRGR